jgi:hypothetical protein
MDDGEGTVLEEITRLSHTRRYISLTNRIIRVVYYDGEIERYREEIRWCRCYEGQRVEA